MKMMDNPPERLWDFWPHDGGAPVIWREPCPFPADDADVFEYVLADQLRAAVAAERVECARAAFQACQSVESGYHDENERLANRIENELRLEVTKAILARADADALAAWNAATKGDQHD